MELIKITEQNGEQLVLARDLHEFLEVKKDFSDWIKTYISNDDYGFEENIDYTTFKGNSTESTPRPKIEYILKIDMAKELSMLSRVPKGKQARKYFIECEKKLKEILLPSYMIQDQIKRAEKWIEEQKEKEQLLLTLETQKPLVEFAEKITISESVFTTTQIAKELLMSAKQLNLILANEKVQFKQNGQWLLYSKYQDKEYVKTKTIEYRDYKNNIQTKHSTVWTEKGRMFILDLVDGL